jgi:hypothetical protein
LGTYYSGSAVSAIESAILSEDITEHERAHQLEHAQDELFNDDISGVGHLNRKSRAKLERDIEFLQPREKLVLPNFAEVVAFEVNRMGYAPSPEIWYREVTGRTHQTLTGVAEHFNKWLYYMRPIVKNRNPTGPGDVLEAYDAFKRNNIAVVPHPKGDIVIYCDEDNTHAHRWFNPHVDNVERTFYARALQSLKWWVSKYFLWLRASISDIEDGPIVFSSPSVADFKKEEQFLESIVKPYLPVNEDKFIEACGKRYHDFFVWRVYFVKKFYDFRSVLKLKDLDPIKNEKKRSIITKRAQEMVAFLDLLCSDFASVTIPPFREAVDKFLAMTVLDVKWEKGRDNVVLPSDRAFLGHHGVDKHGREVVARAPKFGFGNKVVRKHRVVSYEK